MRKVFALLLALLLLGSLVTVAFAEDGDSSVVVPEFKIEIIYDYDPPEDGGTVTVHQNEEYIITPHEKDGYVFDSYEISGEYVVVSKDGNNWTIIANSDLVIHVKYKGVTPTPKPQDDNPVSPRTGVNTALYALMFLFGICGVVVAVKKLIKTH